MDKLPQTSFIDAKVALTDIYETSTGVWDHLSNTHKKKNRPLASVALHESESVTEGSELYTVMERYIKNEVYKEIGLSLTEFLNLPLEFVEFLFKTIEISRAKKETENNNILAGLTSKEKKP